MGKKLKITVIIISILFLTYINLITALNVYWLSLEGHIVYYSPYVSELVEATFIPQILIFIYIFVSSIYFISKLYKT